jgi:NADH dehydrogenase
MQSTSDIHAVTGAFGYSGKYIAQRLLAEDKTVITLTDSSHRANPFGDTVRAVPFEFDSPAKLTESLKGVSVLFCTYWVRFNYKNFTYAQAEHNTLTLFEAARAAGVQRVVYVSITNPSEDSPLEYFRGKARLEKALAATGMSHAIVRPTVLFGREDILVNNIAWALRRLPIFGLFGDGQYRFQPIHVDDLARLAVEQGQLRESITLNANGPETFTYRELVNTISNLLNLKRRIISVPSPLAHAIGYLIGKAVHDVTITRDEIHALQHELLYADTPPTGIIKLTDYIQQYVDSLGKQYHSELARRMNRVMAYEHD